MAVDHGISPKLSAVDLGFSLATQSFHATREIFAQREI
jgi:hypothetical protein